MAMDTLFDLLKRIGGLERAPRTSRGDYPAPRSPYKPTLLLAALWRIHRGIEPFSSNRMEFARCLADFSRLYTRIYGNSLDMEVKASQAFWYLGAGKPQLWELVPKPGMEDQLASLIDAKAQVKTANKLAKHVAFARFSPDHWNLLSDSDVQKALISFLIAEQFIDIRRELDEL